MQVQLAKKQVKIHDGDESSKIRTTENIIN